MADWIPVTKRLPKPGQTVLCFFKPMVGEKFNGANFATATMSTPRHWHNPEDDEDDYAVPTLWMPIPPIPDGVTGADREPKRGQPPMVAKDTPK